MTHSSKYGRYVDRYVQPIEVLDAAWDALMREQWCETDQFRSVVQMFLLGVEPSDVSHLIDVVITAVLESDCRKTLALQTQEADLLFRLVREALQAPTVHLADSERAAGADLQMRIAELLVP